MLPLLVVAALLTTSSSALGLLGAFLLYRCGDANRKIGLSVISVGLIDEEPKKSLRRIAEKNNQRYEQAGFGLIVLASVLGLVSTFLQLH
jgi:hypothetical protein